MPDKAFLIQCTCNGDVCKCGDFSSSNQPTKQKDHSMSSLFTQALSATEIRGNFKLPLSKAQQFTKLSEYLRCATIPDREQLLDDVIANASDLPAPTLRRMAKSLNAAAAALETQQSKKAQRLRALHAAMSNDNDDEQINAAIALARGEMRRLGYNITDVPRDGFDVVEMNKKMRELDWSDERRQTLKSVCAAIGLIES